MQTYTVVNENIIKDLVAIVGNKYVLTEKDRLVLYGQDEGADRKAYRLPEAVVLPATTEEVAAVMQLAVKYHIAAFPAVPEQVLKVGLWLISMEALYCRQNA